jgi:N-acetylmuramoyl-L-alanine amidase
LNSTRRFAVRIGSVCALLALLAGGIARADSASYQFLNSSITFTHLSRAAGPLAVGIDDPGLATLLHAAGATLTWRPGERYVLITSALPQVISFSVGDQGYQVGQITATAAFAPFLMGTEVYLPFDDLMHALYIASKRDGGFNVLEPQLASVDVEGSSSQAVLVAHAGARLAARVVASAADRVVYEFDGVGSDLPPSRTYDAGGIRSIEIATEGTIRAPKTLVTVYVAPGTRHDPPHSQRGDFEVGFGANGSAPPLVAAATGTSATAATFEPAATPAPQPEPLAQEASPQPVAGGSLATVNAVEVVPANGGATLNVAVSGNANFEWHRLRAPDNRFWIDITGAQLAGGQKDEAEADPLASLRVRQIDPQTVRIAISFSGTAGVQVSPSATGLTVTIGRTDDVANAPRSGEGSIGTVVSVNEPQALVTPVPPDAYGQNPGGDATAPWKFGGPVYVPTNPRLIVIDPGHGGSDRGAIHGPTSEADTNLDFAKRLQAVLVARGWQVVMTRSTDVDVYKPNDSAHDELQARVDVANRAGARLFVSLHCNSFINSGPSGTTIYYSKTIDEPLARDLDRTLAANLGTKDDGTVKSHLYVTLHTNMPAVLIETAFLSNPDDYARLIDPDWRQRLVVDVADGIDQYAQQNPVQGMNQ